MLGIAKERRCDAPSLPDFDGGDGRCPVSFGAVSPCRPSELITLKTGKELGHFDYLDLR